MARIPLCDGIRLGPGSGISMVPYQSSRVTSGVLRIANLLRFFRSCLRVGFDEGTIVLRGTRTQLKGSSWRAVRRDPCFVQESQEREDREDLGTLPLAFYFRQRCSTVSRDQNGSKRPEGMVERRSGKPLWKECDG